MKGRVALVSLLVVSLVACDNKSEIKVYRVSKAPLEETGPEQQGAMPANAPSPSMPGGMARLRVSGAITKRLGSVNGPSLKGSNSLVGVLMLLSGE